MLRAESAQNCALVSCATVVDCFCECVCVCERMDLQDMRNALQLVVVGHMMPSAVLYEMKIRKLKISLKLWP